MVADLRFAGSAPLKVSRVKNRVGALLLHGLTGVPSEMRPLSRQLAEIGAQVAVPLLPGHGGTHKELLATTWKDWLAGARASLDELAEQCNCLVVAGLSMGALLAAMLAAEDKRVSGIVLMSTTMRYDGRDTPPTDFLLPLVDLLPFTGRWFYWTEKPPYGLKDPRLQRLITRQVEAAKRGENTEFGLFRTYAGSLRQMTHLVNQLRRKAGKVQCPALIMHSLEDTITSIRNATEIYSLLGSQDKSVSLLTGCDHVLTLDLQKHEVAQRIADFVFSLDERSLPQAEPCAVA